MGEVAAIGHDGKPMKYLGVPYDIAEAEIERQNARGIIAAIHESRGFIEFDLAGKVLGVDRNFPWRLGFVAMDVAPSSAQVRRAASLAPVQRQAANSSPGEGSRKPAATGAAKNFRLH